MRRVIVLAAVLLIGVAAIITIVAPRNSPPRAFAAPLNPLKGKAVASIDARALAAPLDRFGLTLLAQEAQSTTGNVVISPLSVHDVLSMILNGANGETAAQMRHVLGLGTLPLGAVNQGWADLISAAQAGKTPAIEIANSLWLRDGIPFNDAFLAANRDFYAAGINTLPGDPAKAAADINAWVGDHTAGLIKQIVEPSYFDSQTILALVNTVHLKAAWTTAFDPNKTGDEPFTLEDGSKVRVPMMNAEVSAPIAQTRTFDAIALQSKGPVTAWVIVPKGDQTPETVVAQFARRGLGTLYRAARPQSAMLALPRFKTEFSSPDLKPALTTMGMPLAFSPDQAELQGIVASGTLGPGRVYIQRVVHKAVLSVNENGFEAAAATVALVGATGMPFAPISIRADRPFLMVLTEKGTSAPLFMAIIRDPAH